MISTFLDPAELAELTGRVRSDAQVRALRQMGIEHRIRADGKVVVLRSHMEQIFGMKQSTARKEKEIEPDWSAI